jgi:hypothetical protein
MTPQRMEAFHRNQSNPRSSTSRASGLILLPGTPVRSSMRPQSEDQTSGADGAVAAVRCILFKTRSCNCPTVSTFSASMSSTSIPNRSSTAKTSSTISSPIPNQFSLWCRLCLWCTHPRKTSVRKMGTGSNFRRLCEISCLYPFCPVPNSTRFSVLSLPGRRPRKNSCVPSVWRTHSCVPRRHACRRPGPPRHPPTSPNLLLKNSCSTRFPANPNALP